MGLLRLIRGGAVENDSTSLVETRLAHFNDSRLVTSCTSNFVVAKSAFPLRTTSTRGVRKALDAAAFLKRLLTPAWGIVAVDRGERQAISLGQSLRADVRRVFVAAVRDAVLRKTFTFEKGSDHGLRRTRTHRRFRR